MSRPSISMACILKNEAHNIGGMLQSVRGCFDEIVMVDTGSTDNSVEFLESINKLIAEGQPNWAGLPEIKIYHFDWINDFAAARNFAFSKCTQDYVFWQDLDDVLSDSKAFIRWRDNVMHAGHYWLATYNYAYDPAGQVTCKFIRERVIKNNFGFKWKYFVHEGLLKEDGGTFWTQQVNTWTINHRRTAEDIKSDHMRNIKIFESHPEPLEPRMNFYYGKELVENGFPEKGGAPLMEALKSEHLDIHDRILATQYAIQSAANGKAWVQAIELAMNGLKLMPNRAEYWCLLGDIYQAINQPANAVMNYRGALCCEENALGGIVVIDTRAYKEYPLTKLTEIYLHQGRFDLAEEHIEMLSKHNPTHAESFQKRLVELKNLSTIRTNLVKSEDIIITCPPQGAVTDWDENTLAEKGHGGSETAAIEVARWLKKKTNRAVKIFHPRAQRDVMPSGVEYIPSSELVGYVQNVEPHAHIAWRHPTRLTNAKSYIWCHDLQCPGANVVANYDKIVALSEFHKEYLIETNGVPEDKIVLGFNGINPDDFSEPAVRDPLKVVFSSSPDRGLAQTIDIVKKAREISKLDIKLHCFYGFENMRKAGQNEWADRIEAKIKENSDFVTHHGQVNKKVLMKNFKEAAVWLYVNDFIESYCITAIEALCAGAWPIVRDMGALKYTMKEALDKGMCDFLTLEVTTDASIGIWANTLVEAILDKKWQRVDISPEKYSWEKVADLFIKELEL